MEWASGIELVDGRFVARIQDASCSRVAPLDSLTSGGLPTARRSKLVIEQEIRKWREADPTEYLLGIGMPTSAGMSRHSVYVCDHPRDRVLIPALALMRAFFRPTSYLLPKMFLPQALDQVRLADDNYLDRLTTTILAG